MQEITFLLKPSCVNCNLKCTYCFNKKMSHDRKNINEGLMDINVIKTLINKCEADDVQKINFIFQGGEPLLMGVGFYEKVFELQKNSKINFANSFQTNATLINEDWIKLFKKEDVLLGISLDGTEKIHDINRIDAHNKGTYQKIITAIKLLDQNKINYNILSVVNKHNVNFGEEIYNHFKELNFKNIQFIPCIDHQELEINNKEYAKFLNDVFALWYSDIANNNYISIRDFDNFVHKSIGLNADACAMNGACYKYFTVQPSGDLYPCDFYVKDEYKVGNILDTELTSIINSKKHEEFIKCSTIFHEECKQCKYVHLCRNNCNRNRIDNKYIYCQATKDFFDENYDKINQLGIELLHSL